MKTLADDRRRWTLAFLGAIAVGAGLAVWLQGSLEPPRESKLRSPNALGGQIVIERVVPDEAALLDKTPLFLPTEWNTSTKVVSLPKTGGVFADFPSTFALVEEDQNSGKIQSGGEISATTVLDLERPESTALGFGRGLEGNPASDVEKRSHLEVFSAKNGVIVLREALAVDVPVKSDAWTPIEMMAVVSAAGLVGPPILMTRSGIDEVDMYFADFLVKVLRIGEKLSPGVYQIVVGP